MASGRVNAGGDRYDDIEVHVAPCAAQWLLQSHCGVRAMSLFNCRAFMMTNAQALSGNDDRNRGNCLTRILTRSLRPGDALFSGAPEVTSPSESAW